MAEPLESRESAENSSDLQLVLEVNSEDSQSQQTQNKGTSSVPTVVTYRKRIPKGMFELISKANASICTFFFIWLFKFGNKCY